MWPDTEEGLKNTMEDVSKRAATYNRKIDFGLRIHVIVEAFNAKTDFQTGS
jgi:alkanesulfonate monooxygenase